MANVDILSRFEVNLPEEVVVQLSQADAGCESENWGQLLDGAPESQCCVQLQKVDQTLVKLFVTFYGTKPEAPKATPGDSQDQTIQTEKVESKDAPSQAIVESKDAPSQANVESKDARSQANVESKDAPIQAIVDTSTGSMQTDKPRQVGCDQPDSQHQLSQTEKVASKDNHSQVIVDTSNGSMQTDKRVLITAGCQTEFEVVLVQPKADCQTQAGGWTPVEAITQTSMSWFDKANADSQTIIKSFSEGACQAVVAVRPSVTQTEIAVANSECQTERHEQQAACQTERNENVAVTQTNRSMALECEQAVQAVVGQTSTESQAVVDQVLNVTQTDSSMALQVDQDAQATVACDETFAQTDIREYCETSIQAECEMGVMSSQTDPEPEPEPEPEPATMLASQQSEVESVPDIPAGFDTPVKSQSTIDGLELYREESSQTDPVTIIIGDASFLVKKLKSSALSPTKVSSTGNEIEIELRADPECEFEEGEVEKENAAMIEAARRQQAVTSGRGGVRTRGGTPGRGRGRPRSTTMPQMVQMPLGSAGAGKYSCPLCPDTFQESPALYDHLSQWHKEAFGMIKKPKGREGKTILMKKPMEEMLEEPPILTPMEPIMLQQQQSHSQTAAAEANDEGQVEDGGGLFEDPGEPIPRQRTTPGPPRRRRMEGPTGSAVAETQSQVVEEVVEADMGFSCPVCPEKFCRSSQLLAHLQFSHNAKVAEVKSGQHVVKVEAPIDAMPNVAQEEAPVTPGKRKRDFVEAVDSKRLRSEEEEDYEEEDEEGIDEGDEVSVKKEPATRRRGRSAVQADDASSPRTRGRLRTARQ